MTLVYSLSALVRQLALQQLRRAAQAAQRILDLVRQLPQHHAAAVQPRQHVVLARDALPRRGVGELQQQVRAGDLAFQRRDGHIHDARFARRGLQVQHQFAIREGLAGLDRAAQDRNQAVGFQQVIAEGPAAALVQADGQQILRGDIGVDRTQLRVQQDDPGRERIQQIRGVEMRQR